MKYEWKKHEKKLYGAKQTPALIVVPAQNYIMINGEGNPNHVDFANRVAALYSLAYAVKMRYKTSTASDIDDYSIYPLEGVWNLKESKKFAKEDLQYSIMIRQPDFITQDMVNGAVEIVKQKKANPLYEEICFHTVRDGRCVEILHVGAYDDEPTSLEKMARFIEDNGLKRCGEWHREIYLNHANRVDKSRLKTILRYQIT